MADSLADRAVYALAQVSTMDDDMTNDDEERHIVRQLKRAAELAMANAFHLATELAYQAKDVRNTFKTRKNPTP